MKTMSMLAFALLAIIIIGCASTARSIVEHIPKETVQVEPLNIGDEQKQVNLIYYENQIPQRGVRIYVQYYDEALKKGVTESVVSDTSGIARIAIPAARNGASSVFRFSLEKAVLGQLTAIRIPAKMERIKSGQKMITLQFDSSTRMMNDSPMELMRFPADGSEVGSGGDIFTGRSSWKLKR